MDIFLQNSIISDTSLSDQEIAVYTALRSLYVSAQDTQIVSYNIIGYTLYNNKFSNNALTCIKDAFHSLVDRGLIVIVKQFSTTEFSVDLSKLYFENDYYTIIRLDEVQTIMSIDNRMDKFKLLRYFITCLRTICHSQGVYGDNQSTVQNIAGFMSQKFLCQECNINYQTNFKLIEQYNSVLEENKILYVYRHTRIIRDENGQVKNLNNHYGRYEMKDDIVTFALNYEEYLGIYDRNDTVQSKKSNENRRKAAYYNNICTNMEKCLQTYSDDIFIQTFLYIHEKNTIITYQLKDIDNQSYANNLREQLRDETIFLSIPCVLDYMLLNNIDVVKATA